VVAGQDQLALAVHRLVAFDNAEKSYACRRDSYAAAQPCRRLAKVILRARSAANWKSTLETTNNQVESRLHTERRFRCEHMEECREELTKIGRQHLSEAELSAFEHAFEQGYRPIGAEQ